MCIYEIGTDITAQGVPRCDGARRVAFVPVSHGSAILLKGIPLFVRTPSSSLVRVRLVAAEYDMLIPLPIVAEE